MQIIVVAVLFAGFLEYTDTLASASVLTVSLSYFSGRRDPKWEITPTTPNYAEITQLYNTAKTSKAILLPTNMPAKLGYRGFLVSENEKATPGLIVGPKTKELQKLLLQSAQKPPLSANVIKKVTAAIDKGVQPLMAGRKKRVAPDYPDATWDAAHVTRCNNCYNYATNVQSPPGFGFGVPGLGGGVEHNMEFITANNVMHAAMLDGLQLVPPGPGDAIPAPNAVGHLVAIVVDPANDVRIAAVPDGLQMAIPVPNAAGHIVAQVVAPENHVKITAIPDEGHLVALVVAPDSAQGANDGDFHWYRLDSNNRWSHKRGETPITDEDANDNEINDPRLAANDPDCPDYQFVCFMYIDNTATIQGIVDNVCHL